MDNSNFIALCGRLGVPLHTIKINDHNNLPTLCGKDVLFALFDGIAFAVYDNSPDDQYIIRRDYPLMSDVLKTPYCMAMIGTTLYPNQKKFDITQADVAVCLGGNKLITAENFSFTFSQALCLNEKMPGRLHFFKTKYDFLTALDGKVYGVSDTKGKLLCEIHEQDYILLMNEKKVYDSNDIDLMKSLEIEQPDNCESDIFLADESYRDCVYNRRIEILILDKK